MKVALTGGSGLLGRHLCALLSSRGIAQARIDRADWDLRDWSSDTRFDTLTDGADVFVHCAALIPGGHSADPSAASRDLYDINVRATVNIAQWAARRDMHLIFVSSGSVYSDPHATAIPETAPVGPGPLGGEYAATKRMAEMAVAELTASAGLRATILRPSSLYGYGLPQDKFLIRMLADAEAGAPVTVTGPDNSIDFVHAHDLSRAIVQAAEHRATGVYNIAGGGAVRLQDLGQMIVALGTGQPGRLIIQPGNDVSFTRFALDDSAARNAFGYSPALSLRTGLEMTLGRAVNPPAR